MFANLPEVNIFDLRTQIIILSSFVALCLIFWLIYKYILHLDKRILEASTPKKRKKIIDNFYKISIVVGCFALVLLLLFDIPDFIWAVIFIIDAAFTFAARIIYWSVTSQEKANADELY